MDLKANLVVKLLIKTEEEKVNPLKVSYRSIYST